MFLFFLKIALFQQNEYWILLAPKNHGVLSVKMAVFEKAGKYYLRCQAFFTEGMTYGRKAHLTADGRTGTLPGCGLPPAIAAARRGGESGGGKPGDASGVGIVTWWPSWNLAID